ncbi:MAG TPA: hypothetical protein VKV26_01825 [Dehalococcoidia bacterium]|nr:hypothetical protein [Dehalococcoidia bacterium]
MYAIRASGIAAAGKAAQFEAWYVRFVQHLKTQPGYLRSVLFNSSGIINRYTSLVTFSDRKAAQAFDGPYAQFIAANPVQDLIEVATPLEAWELLTTNGGAVPSGGAVAMVEVSVDPNKAQAFEQSRTELLALIAQQGRGFVRNGLWRFGGGPGRYLIAHGHATREDVIASLNEVPQIARFLAANPLAGFLTAPPAFEECTVTTADVPATVAQRR